MISLKKYPYVANDTQFCLELTSVEAVDETEDIRYTTYGLRVLDEDGNTLFAALNIDTNRESVERFVEFCAAGEIRLIHMPDLLEDYLVDLC